MRSCHWKGLRLLFTFKASWKPLGGVTPSRSCSLGGQLGQKRSVGHKPMMGTVGWWACTFCDVFCRAFCPVTGHNGPLFVQTKWQNLEQYGAVFVKNKTKPQLASWVADWPAEQILTPTRK